MKHVIAQGSASSGALENCARQEAVLVSIQASTVWSSVVYAADHWKMVGVRIGHETATSQLEPKVLSSHAEGDPHAVGA